MHFWPILTFVREEKEKTEIKEKRIDAILMASDDLKTKIKKLQEKNGNLQIELNIKEGEVLNFQRQIAEFHNMAP